MTEPTPIRRRRYSKRTKVTAIVAAEMTSISASARANGIPRKTVAYWMDAPDFAIYRQKTREDLAAGSLALANEALSVIRAKLDTFEPRDLTTLVGVLTDKAQLLAGQATSRTETRDITETMTPDAVDALADEIDAWLLERKAKA
jgi:hypothetical protein